MRILPVLTGIILMTSLKAQVSDDAARDIRLYRPPVAEPQDTIPVSDTLDIRGRYSSDSIEARQQFLRDSVAARMKFMQDSILAREIFVRDSILRRQRTLDSLNLLKSQLQRLLDASLRAVKDDIIIRQGKIEIIGDSVLSDYVYTILPFDLTKPFTPWKKIINLSDNPVSMKTDKTTQRIISIQSPSLTCSFKHGTAPNILIINEPGVILDRREGRLYSSPFDTVFFDLNGRIVKIKRYIHLHLVENNYQRGAPLFVYLSQVKQYEYDRSGQMTRHQVVSFCERRSTRDEHKVCFIITYSLNISNNTYILTRRNDPANDYSDGTFTCEFDNHLNLKSLAFRNTGNSENWKTFVELNEEGNVSRYLYQINDFIPQSLDIIYHLDDPGARHQTELINNTFEKDGVCYYQKNKTTGKSRQRDRLTGEWGPWR
ncbi:MAG: hypothetical protein JW723_08640 [Bacteroidales bacterium]|nr:hypothetical protein [Bacteroidales bacterium]